MAHQSQNIAWDTLAAQLEYTLISGDENRDLWALEKPNLKKGMIHFASTLVRTIREYAAIERHKHATKEEYGKRAATWTSSNQSPDVTEIQSQETRQNVRRRPQKEDRKVMTDVDRSLWHSYAQIYHSRIEIEVQYIETWLSNPGPANNENWPTVERWYAERQDVIKMLIQDTALVSTPLHKRQFRRDDPASTHHNHVDTLFLLAHHPNIDIPKWDREYCVQCWHRTGPTTMIKSVLSAYIYFNLLQHIRNTSFTSTTPALFIPTTTIPAPSRDPYAWPRFKVPLRPRPAYMNSPSYQRLHDKLLYPHPHRSDRMVFEAFMYPAPGENFSYLRYDEALEQADQERRERERLDRYGRGSCDRQRIYGQTEVDVMGFVGGEVEESDGSGKGVLARRGTSAALREFVRGLWKMLVVYEMLWRDVGQPPVWEEIVCEELMELFKVPGKAKWAMFFDTWDEMDECDFVELFDPEKKRNGKGECDDGKDDVNGDATWRQYNSAKHARRETNTKLRLAAGRRARAGESGLVPTCGEY